MIPEISHVEFLVLNILKDTERSGIFINTLLDRDCKVKSFNQLMKKMESDGLVTKKYEQYKITNTGKKARYDTLKFYLGTLNA